jgi:hypothetical protein
MSADLRRRKDEEKVLRRNEVRKLRRGTNDNYIERMRHTMIRGAEKAERRGLTAVMMAAAGREAEEDAYYSDGDSQDDQVNITKAMAGAILNRSQSVGQLMEFLVDATDKRAKRPA